MMRMDDIRFMLEMADDIGERIPTPLIITEKQKSLIYRAVQMANRYKSIDIEFKDDKEPYKDAYLSYEHNEICFYIGDSGRDPGEDCGVVTLDQLKMLSHQLPAFIAEVEKIREGVNYPMFFSEL